MIPEKEKEIKIPPPPTTYTNDVELKLSQDMTKFLEKRCSELGKLLDSETFAKKQLELKLQTMEKVLQDAQDEINE